MQKILSVIVIIGLFVVAILLLWGPLSPISYKTGIQINLLNFGQTQLYQITSSEPVTGQSGQIIIDKNVWDVQIAKNEADRTAGLSNKHVLYPENGMLFAFDNLVTHYFWMKDMLIPIDIIFFDNNWKIVLIESNLQPNTFPNTFGGGVKSQYVMEINAMEANVYGLAVGDQAIFLNK